MARLHDLALVWALGMLCACGPTPGPATVMALLPDTHGTVAPTRVILTSVTDVPTLEGTATRFVGGASVFIDRSPGALQAAVGPSRDAFDWGRCLRDEGHAVQARFIDRDGVLWPADFHSWNMVTAFYNFERAAQYFTRVTATKLPTELSAQRVLYWPSVRYETGDDWRDNALYVSVIKSFVLVGFDTLQQVPLAMNAGVIGHEVAHRVFNARALADSALHPALLNWPSPALNLLRSIDEGFADFHGYGVTCAEPSGCRSAFLRGSVAEDAAQARDLARADRCLDAATRNALGSASGSEWSAPGGKMYIYGSLWAAALYRAATRVGRDTAMSELQRALVAAYDDGTAETPGLRQLIGGGDFAEAAGFTPEAVADVLVSHVADGPLRVALCSELLTRLQLECTEGPSSLCEQLPHCPGTAAAQACP